MTKLAANGGKVPAPTPLDDDEHQHCSHERPGDIRPLKDHPVHRPLALMICSASRSASCQASCAGGSGA